MEQHRKISIDGREVHYRDEGRNNRETLVLLHGFLQNLDVWTPYTLHFMRELRVITIDLPGHGYTECFSDVHSMDFMARVVKSVLEEVGVQKCVMVGHSMGGYVALAFADQFPYSLCGLGLLHSHALADTPEKKEERNRICEEVKHNRPGYIVGFLPTLFDDSRRMGMAQEIKDLQDECLETSENGIVAAQRGMAMRPSRLDLLARIDIPVLSVFGKNDTRLPVELAVSQAMEPKRSEILLLDKVAHMAHMEESEYVRQRLLNFVHTCYANQH